MAKEKLLSFSEANKSVLDSMIYSGKRTITGDMKLIESETLDYTMARFFYENAFGFYVADSLSFAALVDQCLPDGMHTCVCTRAQHHS